MEVLRVLAVAVVGVVVGEFNLLLVTPLDDADDIRKSIQKKHTYRLGKLIDVFTTILWG